ncbi:uncharacterized protein LOC117322759 [Pecten maximus]|uniref:uncharacterized protein LOC117322759 n=1 Tax=Pecten maximus TaxID=6579 RepID=UPI001458A0B1|nr:uncharacterized protein LOC117322759 [Pecten maximus]
MSEEGFRQKFRTCKPEVGETSAQFVVRIGNYLDRWIDMSNTDHTFETLRDLLLQEQFVNASHKNLALFLKERNQKDSTEMAKLADQYLEAHNGVDLASFGKPKGSKAPYREGNHNAVPSFSDSEKEAFKKERRCYSCGGKGHIARECKSKRAQTTAAMIEQASENQSGCSCSHTKDSEERKQGKQKGGKHYQKSRETAAACSVPLPSDLFECCTQESEVVLKCGHHLPIVSAACGNSRVQLNVNNGLPVAIGYIGEVEVSVLRDTGCSGIVVKRNLVSEQQLTSKVVTCVLIDGTVRKVPVAKIVVDTPYFKGETDVLCFENPIYDLIIGNIPGVREPEHQMETPNTEANKWEERKTEVKQDSTILVQAVETRAQIKKVGIKPTALKVPCVSGTDIGKEEFKKIQNEDDSLQHLKDFSRKGGKRKIGKYNYAWFVVERDLLKRKFQSEKTDHGKIITQLVVPKKLRQSVMEIGHRSTLAGHLGAKKTTEKILTQFYWPGFHQDVKLFCRSCDLCQKTFPKGRVTRVPMTAMPLIDEPFRRVAVDIVGPIHPMTERKHRFILTLVDFATRYPEAVPLQTIDTEQVAEALVQIFSRVGVPHEILSDQGSQFTSGVMKEVGRPLSMKQITTTPYHPQCNGLVERFNGTLKSMLKKICVEKPNDWDRYLGAVLFAYREAPQDYMGFSPFELLYGRTVRGPMSILRELWTKEVEPPEVQTTYQYVLNLRNILEETCDIAQKELRKSQVRHKHHFDRKARDRGFKERDQVLILLPTDNNKLLMQWKGPFEVKEAIGQNNYRIQIKGKVKVYHANMLKKYLTDVREVRKPVGCMEIVGAAVISEDEDEDVALTNESEIPLPGLQAKESISDVKVAQDLDDKQQSEVRYILQEHSKVLTDLPGNCKIGEHVIKLTTDEPIRSKPYPVPHAMRETVSKEVKTMLEMGVIEPSTSPYASSVVLVKKPDNTNRFCIDYRRLNTVTVFDAEPMPDPEEIFSKISMSKFFTKIDLSNAISVRTYICVADRPPATGVYEQSKTTEFKDHALDLVITGLPIQD